MKKFAAIFAAVILTVSVLVVSASAKLFADDTEYVYTGAVTGLPIQVPTGGVSCSSFVVYDSLGSVVFSYSFPQETILARNTYSGGTNINAPQFYGFLNGNLVYEIFCPVDIPSDASLVAHSSVSASYTGFTRSDVVVPAAVSSLGSSIFNAGDSLISFVTSSWLTLVALGAFLVVLCIGAIRRLVKGV